MKMDANFTDDTGFYQCHLCPIYKRARGTHTKAINFMATQKISKKEQRRQQVAQQKRKKRLLTWIPILAILLLLVGTGIYRFTRPDIEGLINFGTLSSKHGQTTASQVVSSSPNFPPVGGDHSGNALPCNVYSSPVDSASAIHSLEHGAVWLAYRPDLPADEVAELAALAQRESKVLMSPYSGLEGDVVMTTWSRQLTIDDLPDERVEEFISRYRSRAPEGGVAC
jgi:Protein of unknown function (DUF3105)